MYASTREAELAITGWTDEVKGAFLRSQFEAQDRYYRAEFPGARFDVVLVQGEPAGRLTVARQPDRMHIIDIALLPAFQNQGIGSAILRELLAEAGANGCCVSIHVEQVNPAQRLYRRLGFEPVEARGLYLFMEWRPGVAPDAPVS